MEASMSIEPTWPEFKMMSKEFFDNLPTLNIDEADNAFKCLSLGYLGLKGNKIEQHQASIVLQIAGRQKIQHEIGIPIH